LFCRLFFFADHHCNDEKPDSSSFVAKSGKKDELICFLIFLLQTIDLLSSALNNLHVPVQVFKPFFDINQISAQKKKITFQLKIWVIFAKRIIFGKSGHKWGFLAFLFISTRV